MDVRAYFKKIRKIERELPADDVVVVSLATVDGGHAGRFMELNRPLAAKMLADERARLATDDEAAKYREQIQREQEDIRSRSIGPRAQFLVDLTEVRKSASKGRKN